MSSNPPIFDADDVRKATEHMVTPELADYAVQRVERILKANRLLDACKGTLDTLKNIAHTVHLKFKQNTDSWAGQLMGSLFQNYQFSLAEEAKQEMHNKVAAGSIQFDWAMDAAGHFVRGHGGDPIDANPEMGSAIDKLFNAWLAKLGGVSENGVIYQADPISGEIKKFGAKGQEFPIDKDWLAEVINDSKDGFIAFITDKDIRNVDDKPVEVKVQQQEFPEEFTEEVAEQLVSKEEAAALEKAAKPAQANQEEVTKPQSDQSTGISGN